MMQPRAVPTTTVAALDTWAAQKRSMLLGRDEPLACTLGRLKTQKSAAGAGDARRAQRWPEVFTGTGLLVQMIIGALSEYPRLTISFYYVLRWPWRVPIPAQAAEIGIGKREYWRQLEIAEVAVDVALQFTNRSKDPS